MEGREPKGHFSGSVKWRYSAPIAKRLQALRQALFHLVWVLTSER